MNYDFTYIITELNNALFDIDNALQDCYTLGFEYRFDGYNDTVLFGGIRIWDSANPDDVDDISVDDYDYLKQEDFKAAILKRARNITRRCEHSLNNLVEKRDSI